MPSRVLHSDSTTLSREPCISTPGNAFLLSAAATESPPSWRHLVPAGALLVISALALLALTARPAQGLREAAVLLPPWDGLLKAEAVAAQVDGRLVDAGGLPNVYIIEAQRADLVSALYHAGAWLVINPLGAHGCLPASPTTITNSQGI